MSTYPNFEYVLLVFGIIFNRWYGFIPYLFMVGLSYFYAEDFNEILKVQLEAQVDDGTLRLRLMYGFFIFLFILTMTTLLVSAFLKKLSNRARPKYVNQNRLCNLRGRENHSKSMPSGDTTQGALWCGCMAVFFEQEYVLLFLPLVAYARVYYQCHWIGDTIMGALLGITMSLIAFASFPYFEPMFNFIINA